MKESKILEIKIQNFKGIANGTFNFNGENTEIVADVMQGKSTIKEAYLWALGMEVDNFYPCDKNNQLIDGLETRVELTLDIDGIEYVLSRSAKVKYKNKVFDGYKKDMFEFDRVPCNTTEYKTKLCDLLGVDNFDTLKYLTILNYFNEQVNWKDRRALIYDLFVDKTAIDSLKDNEKYSLIRNELLKGKTSADINTMLNSENNHLVDSKRKNEILLADKQNELATFENINYANIESELALVETQITEEQKRIDTLDKQSIVHDINSRIWDLKEELSKFRFADGGKIRVLNNREYCLKVECEELKMEGTNLEKQIETLTAEYKELKVAQFDESNTICPTCHQPLKQADIDELRSTWVNNQESRLTSLKDTILSLKKQLETIKEEYTAKLAELEVAKQELDNFKPNSKIDELLQKIQQLESELEKCETQPIDTSYLAELKDKRNFLIIELGKKDSHEKIKAKIDQLIVEQRELVNQEIVLAKKRSQLEQYTLDIIALVNDSINSHFDGVKFKLFEVLTATAQKSLKETIVCLNNGIDYESQSTGQKANSNCIIVSTLQKRLGVELPIWLDDASILNLKNEPSNQLIYLLNEKGRELNCTKIKDLYERRNRQ
jgi:DNA repair exonuclease SbcCD ATPase subunit